jgi:hypothetical protein
MTDPISQDNTDNLEIISNIATSTDSIQADISTINESIDQMQAYMGSIDNSLRKDTWQILINLFRTQFRQTTL